MNRIFSKKSGIRHLIMLGISIVLFSLVYTTLAIRAKDWFLFFHTYDETNKHGIMPQISLLLWFFVSSGIMGIISYWFVRYLSPILLKKYAYHHFGWLPFLKFLHPNYPSTPEGLLRKHTKIKKQMEKLDSSSEEYKQLEQTAQLIWDDYIRAEREKKDSELAASVANDEQEDNWKAYNKRRNSLLIHLLRSRDRQDDREMDDEYYYGEMPEIYLAYDPLARNSFFHHFLRGIICLFVALMPVFSPWIVLALGSTFSLIPIGNIALSIFATILITLLLIVHPIITFLRNK